MYNRQTTKGLTKMKDLSIDEILALNKDDSVKYINKFNFLGDWLIKES